MYKYEESIKILISRIPSLKVAYEDDIDYYEGLPYVFYEGVFSKYIIEKIEAKDDIILLEIFKFVEDMLANGDSKTKNLVEVAVIESLNFHSKFTWNDTYLLRFYGRLTKQSFQKCIQ